MQQRPAKMDETLAELEAEAFSAEHEDPLVPSTPFLAIAGLPVFLTPHATLTNTSEPAGESAPSGWCEVEESEPRGMLWRF